jgi:hypothetical protein
MRERFAIRFHRINRSGFDLPRFPSRWNDRVPGGMAARSSSNSKSLVEKERAAPEGAAQFRLSKPAREESVPNGKARFVSSSAW